MHQFQEVLHRLQRTCVTLYTLLPFLWGNDNGAHSFLFFVRIFLGVWASIFTIWLQAVHSILH